MACGNFTAWTLYSFLASYEQGLMSLVYLLGYLWARPIVIPGWMFLLRLLNKPLTTCLFSTLNSTLWTFSSPDFKIGLASVECVFLKNSPESSYYSYKPLSYFTASSTTTIFIFFVLCCFSSYSIAICLQKQENVLYRIIFIKTIKEFVSKQGIVYNRDGDYYNVIISQITRPNHSPSRQTKTTRTLHPPCIIPKKTKNTR